MVDDNLVETDKIGSGAFFWALPSKGFQSRKNLIDNVTNHIAQISEEIKECERKIAAEKETRTSNDGDRESMLKELEQARKENNELSGKLRLFEKCDPKRLDEIAVKKKACHEGMVRWTDNLYTMENWIKKNN